MSECNATMRLTGVTTLWRCDSEEPVPHNVHTSWMHAWTDDGRYVPSGPSWEGDQ